MMWEKCQWLSGERQMDEHYKLSIFSVGKKNPHEESLTWFHPNLIAYLDWECLACPPLDSDKLINHCSRWSAPFLAKRWRNVCLRYYCGPHIDRIMWGCLLTCGLYERFPWKKLKRAWRLVLKSSSAIVRPTCEISFVLLDFSESHETQFDRAEDGWHASEPR